MWLYSTQCGNSHWQAWFLDATSNTRAQAGSLVAVLAREGQQEYDEAVSSLRSLWFPTAVLWTAGTVTPAAAIITSTPAVRSMEHFSLLSRWPITVVLSPEPHPTCFGPVPNSVERRLGLWNLIREGAEEWCPVRGCTVHPYPVTLVFYRYDTCRTWSPPPRRPAVPSLSSGLTSSFSILLRLLSIFPLSFCSLLTLSRSCLVSVEMAIVCF